MFKKTKHMLRKKSIKQQKENRNVVSSYEGVLYSHKKEQRVGYNMSHLW